MLQTVFKPHLSSLMNTGTSGHTDIIETTSTTANAESSLKQHHLWPLLQVSTLVVETPSLTSLKLSTKTTDDYKRNRVTVDTTINTTDKTPNEAH